MQKHRNLLCFCMCCFFPGTTSALMRTFTREQYLMYAPREKAKKKNTKQKRNKKQAKNKADKTMWKKKKRRQTRTATCCCFFVCFTFCFVLLYLIILASCIYGWRARLNHTATTCTQSIEGAVPLEARDLAVHTICCISVSLKLKAANKIHALVIRPLFRQAAALTISSKHCKHGKNYTTHSIPKSQAAIRLAWSKLSWMEDKYIASGFSKRSHTKLSL